MNRRPFHHAMITTRAPQGGKLVGEATVNRWRVYRHADGHSWCAQPIPEGVPADPRTGLTRIYRMTWQAALAAALEAVGLR